MCANRLYAVVTVYDNVRIWMENIEGSEWLVMIAMMVNLLMAPGTKVEESFNIQATHDMIYNTYNFSAYDHLSFPGVVPRTFVGPAYLALFGLPARVAMYLGDAPKFWMLFAVRFFLGATTVLVFLNFARAVRKNFGMETAMFLRIIASTQFHFLFYSSRTLPNTFALILVLIVYQRVLNNRYESAVKWATAAALLFRCELILLFAPIFLPVIISGRLPLFGWHGALVEGMKTMLKVLAFTVPLDSFLWGRLVWPEGEVAWFNIFLNKSHEYGVSPFLWYFYSALPRALLSSLFLVPLGILLDRRLFGILLPSFVFVFLYSFLPHKELRFIIYVIPILNLSAAVVCARMYINRSKSWVRLFLYWGCALHIVANTLATLVFIYTASRNYPGGDAIGHLQWTQRIDGTKPLSVYVDNACAQTGVNRFMQLYDAWEYNKTEHMQPVDLERFDFLLIGTYGSNLKDMVMTNYTKWHRVMFAIPAFHKFKFHRISSFPYYFPEIVMTEKVAVLRRRDD